MPQPLMPLRRDVDFGEGCRGRVLYDAAHAVLMGVECVAEFPEGVALEVQSCSGLLEMCRIEGEMGGWFGRMGKGGW